MKDYKSTYGSLVTGSFPNTVAKNASGPGATDGTPYSADFIDDLWGARQDLLAAVGMTPDGIAEAAGSSQFLEAFRRGAGLPPGIIIHSVMSPARQALMRMLPLEGQLVPVDVYDRLTDAVWAGASTNGTVPAFYRCRTAKTRDAAGTHLYLPDARAMFLRGAGVNSEHLAAGDAPYDGKGIGTFIGDASRRIKGSFCASYDGRGINTKFVGDDKLFYGDTPALVKNIINNDHTDSHNGAFHLELDSGRIVPVAHENRPTSLSVLFLISY
jgi:hypothetical protein